MLNIQKLWQKFLSRGRISNLLKDLSQNLILQFKILFSKQGIVYIYVITHMYTSLTQISLLHIVICSF